MSFVLSEEQSMLRDAAMDYTSEQLSLAHYRSQRDAGANGKDPQSWAAMSEMGWAGVLVPEAFGGSEFGYIGLGQILEAQGRTLASTPLLQTALIGASAILLGGSEAQKESVLPRLAEGKLIMALAVDERAHHAPNQISMLAEPVSGGYKLTGRKVFVDDGHMADLLIVPARTSGVAGDAKGITLFLVPAKSDGLKVNELKTLDYHGSANIEFDGVIVSAMDVLGEVDAGAGLLDHILNRACIGLAAEMLGSATAAFETTLEYLQTRSQFGQLIGSFQSLQHRAGIMFTELEQTRSCIADALSALDEGREDVPEAASLAKARAGETLHLVSNEMVQMHGGIGMTDAHEAGFFMKRARVQETLYGGEGYHRDRYANLLGF